tara:strand:- start:298 stop:501 length:204 start_codon:yes stop_codon:yes gene_type:complete
VRALVPEAVFFPAGNIYSQVGRPGVGYTMRPDFNGTAFGVHLEPTGLVFVVLDGGWKSLPVSSELPS